MSPKRPTHSLWNHDFASVLLGEYIVQVDMRLLRHRLRPDFFTSENDGMETRGSDAVGARHRERFQVSLVSRHCATSAGAARMRGGGGRDYVPINQVYFDDVAGVRARL